MEKRRAAIYTTTLVAALAVGILIGREACAPTPEPEVRVEEKIVERTVPAPRPDACACEEEPTPPPEESAAAEPRETEPEPDEEMPDAPPPADPATRQRLLSWVRDRAPSLQPCQPESLTETRFAITLQFGEKGELESVDINAPEEDVSREVLQCLQQRMANWSPPADLVEGRRKVLFGLRL